MSASWSERVEQFWELVDDNKPDLAFAEMGSLVQERPGNDPDATYEWASVHDFLGCEVEAIPLYRKALANGLSGDRRPQAVIQLASSLRNVGEAREAVGLLKDLADDTVAGAATQAFLALALHDTGQSEAALRIALKALAPTLPLYSRAVSSYADDLNTQQPAEERQPKRP